MTTISIIAIFLASACLQMLLWAGSLKLGLKWAKSTKATTRRLVYATAAAFGLHLVVSGAVLYASNLWREPTLLAAIVTSVAALLLPLIVIKSIFETSFAGTLKAWLPTLVVSAIFSRLQTSASARSWQTVSHRRRIRCCRLC